MHGDLPLPLVRGRVPCHSCAPSTPTPPCAQVLLDSVVLGPFYIASFYTYGVLLMEGGGVREVRAKLEADFLPTLAAE